MQLTTTDTDIYQKYPGSLALHWFFLMFINDIEDNLNSTVLKFAYDTKVIKVIDDHHCHADLQNDIKGLEKWAKLWQMQFNVDKCKMMHFGFNNTRHTNTMNNKKLQTVSEEKDLEVIIVTVADSLLYCNYVELIVHVSLLPSSVISATNC